jgi:hypothetical protein
LWFLSSVLFGFAIEGATRLGEDYISVQHREEALLYFKALQKKFQPR